MQPAIQPLPGIERLQFPANHRIAGLTLAIDHQHGLIAEVPVERGAEILLVVGPIQVRLAVQVRVGVTPEGIVHVGALYPALLSIQGHAGKEAALIEGVAVELGRYLHQRSGGGQQCEHQQGDHGWQYATREHGLGLAPRHARIGGGCGHSFVLRDRRMITGVTS